MVLVDSASGGLEMVQISDTGCNTRAYNTGCYRFANMTYSGSRYDLLLYGGEIHIPELWPSRPSPHISRLWPVPTSST